MSGNNVARDDFWYNNLLEWESNVCLSHWDCLDSTQAWVKKNQDLLAKDRKSTFFCAVSAGAQSQGLGQKGRAWYSPHGENLYISYYFPLPKKFPLVQCLAQIGALGLLKTLEKVLENVENSMAPLKHPSPVKASIKTLDSNDSLIAKACSKDDWDPMFDKKVKDLGIKWPNDVLLGGKKIGGILAEVDSHPVFEDHWFVVLGIGLNVFMNHQGCSTIENQKVTSLMVEYPGSYCLENIKKILTQSLWELFTGMMAGPSFCTSFPDHDDVLSGQQKRISQKVSFIQELEKVLVFHNQNIRFQTVHETVIEGIFRGINAQGAVCLDVQGQEHCFFSGRILGISDPIKE
jgi:biotin-(acetyl-CoA carboxylase) ligase